MQQRPVKERVKSHRSRLKEAGFKPVQLWVPDPQAPGFAAECRRQSLIIRGDLADMADLEQMAELADWGDE